MNGQASNSGRPRPRGGGSPSTLDAVMRASTNPPDVVVIESLPEGLNRKETLDPKEDLWLSTADGRYNSAIIPVRVGEGPEMQVFQVHKSVLLQAEWFRKALCGEFSESESQALDLPDEDPAIFHFLVAFLYQGRYVPTRPLADALVPEPGKGKANDTVQAPSESDSDSSSSMGSDSSAESRRRRERRRRREERHLERLRQKHPDTHRPNCNCPQCLHAYGPPCWRCGASRAPPPIVVPLGVPAGVNMANLDRQRATDNPNHRRRGGNGHPVRPPSPPSTAPPDPNGGGRIKDEDMRAWLMAYELHIDVYTCANKYLMDDFKREVARAVVDMLETAGSDAAQPEVLQLCRRLYEGVSEADPLLRMVFARVGFLQPLLWRRCGAQTSAFLVANPEVAALVLRETAARREEDYYGRALPSMERPRAPTLPPMPPHEVPYHHRMPYLRPPRYY